MKLKNLIADKYEMAGFQKLSDEIRNSKGKSDINKVVVSVLQKIITADADGIGKEIKELYSKGNI